MTYVEASVRSRQLVAAARRVMARDGVAGTSMRAVAAEADVPLGTLQYVFPSKERLLRAVIEDVVEEISGLLHEVVEVEQGLAHAVRQGFTTFWTRLVTDQIELQIVQGELVDYALRQPGQEGMARWQYARYVDVIVQWCEEAATRAGETTAVPFDRLARLALAGIDGLTLQYACDPDDERARADLDCFIEMIIELAQIRPAG